MTTSMGLCRMKKLLKAGVAEEYVDLIVTFPAPEGEGTEDAGPPVRYYFGA